MLTLFYPDSITQNVIKNSLNFFRFCFLLLAGVFLLLFCRTLSRRPLRNGIVVVDLQVLISSN